MVGGVADHVGERVFDLLKDLAVELGIAAHHVELDLLIELERQLAHQPRQLLPGVGNRLHAGPHDAFLQLGGDMGQALQRRLELAFAGAPHELEQLVAGEHQLAHRGHQMLERIDADPDGLVSRLRIHEVAIAIARAVRLGRGSGFRPRCRTPGPIELIERDLPRLQQAVAVAVGRATLKGHRSATCMGDAVQRVDQVGVGAGRLRSTPLDAR